jgi:pilus assembly protein CpaB
MLGRRGPTLIVLSLVLALGAAWVANRWLQLRTATPATTGPMTTTVVAASMDLPFGTKIEARHLTTIRMLPGSEPAGAFHELKEVEGKVSRAGLLQGEILLEGRFAEQGSGSTLAAVVEQNMRAVSVRVDDVVGVAGFLLPGNRVDVLGSRDLSNREAQTETILQNVRVLAVDQTASTDKNEPVVVRAVTLEVTPAQAELLVKWKEQGSIQLTLRNPLDEAVQKRAEVVAVVPRAAAPAAAPAKAPTVTVIRGTEVASLKANF